MSESSIKNGREKMFNDREDGLVLPLSDQISIHNLSVEKPDGTPIIQNLNLSQNGGG